MPSILYYISVQHVLSYQQLLGEMIIPLPNIPLCSTASRQSCFSCKKKKRRKKERKKADDRGEIRKVPPIDHAYLVRL